MKYKDKTWHKNAVADLVEFLRTHGPALVEVWRADYVKRDLPLPHSENSWGAVAQSASRQGLIGFTGRFLPSKAPASHGRRQPEWKYTARGGNDYDPAAYHVQVGVDLSKEALEGQVIDIEAEAVEE